MGKTLNTISGPIDVSALGFTLMHEHYLNVDWATRIAFPHLFDPDLFAERAIELSKNAMKYGLRTIVDLSCINMGRDIPLMKRISEASGLQTIVSTGYYFNEEPWMPGKKVSFFADLFIKELIEGIQETPCKAGIIKCATDKYGFTDTNRLLLQASAVACRETGAPIYTHTIANMQQGIEQQRIFEKEGVDLRKTVIGHVGDTDNLSYLKEIMRRGSYVGLDRFGSEFIFPEKNRVENLLRLIDAGYIEQIYISHDLPLYYDWGTNDWETFKATPAETVKIGFAHIPRDVIPILRQHGLSQKEIDVLMVENPRRIFSL